MSAATIYVHIGLAKTGSTFLQKEVFPFCTSVRYLEKPKSDLVTSQNPWDGILNRFFQCSPVVWRDLGPELFVKLFGTTGEHERGGRDTLISDENVCDRPRPVLVERHLNEFAGL